MIRRPPRSTLDRSSAASDVYKRQALALLASARTWAYMEGRSHGVPEDVQAVLPAVVAHRLRGASEFSGDGRALAERLLTQVDIFG